MESEIKINLRGLTEMQRGKISIVLDESLNDCEDDTNETALEVLDQFIED